MGRALPHWNALGGEPLPCSSQVLMAPGVPWLVATSPSSPYLGSGCLFVFNVFVLLSVSWSNFSLCDTDTCDFVWLPDTSKANTEETHAAIKESSLFRCWTPHTWKMGHIYQSQSFFKGFIYLFLKRERNINVIEKWWLVASRWCPTRDQTCNPGMCTEWELIPWSFTLQHDARPTEPHQSGL